MLSFGAQLRDKRGLKARTESEDDGGEDGRLAGPVAAVDEVQPLGGPVFELGMVHEVLQSDLLDVAGLQQSFQTIT